MNRTMKSFKSIVLCVALAVTMLSGCKSQQTEADNVMEQVDDESYEDGLVPLKTDEEGNPELPPIEIVGWLPEDFFRECVKLIEKKFPDRIISYRYIAKTNYSSIIGIELAEGRGPDILFEDKAIIMNHARQGYIIKQNELGSMYSQEGTSNFVYDGDIYAIPGLCQYSGIYYNKTIFEDNGIEVPHTYGEFLEVCRTFKNLGIKPLSMGAYQWDVVQIDAMGYVTAEYLATEDGADFGEKYSKNQGGMRYVWAPYLSRWAAIIDEGIITKDMLIEDNDYAINEFADGQSAMLCGDTTSYTRIIEKSPNLKFAMMPYFGEEEGSELLIGGAMYGFAINTNSKNKDAAQEILELLSTYDGQRAMWQQQRGSDTFLNGITFKKPAEFSGIEDIIQNGRVYMPWAEWGYASGAYMEFGINLQKYIRGEASMDKILRITDGVARSLVINSG